MARTDLGAVSLIHRGAYDPARSYQPFEAVSYQNGYYFVHAADGAPAGTLPIDAARWAAVCDPTDLNAAAQQASAAEAQRATAETARATAETERAASETARATAEAARATAETKRQSDTAAAIAGAQTATAEAQAGAERAEAAADKVDGALAGIAPAAHAATHAAGGSDPITPESIGAAPAGDYLTAETDPTVPEWAKAPAKPAYTAAEVGARPDTWMPTPAQIGAASVRSMTVSLATGGWVNQAQMAAVSNLDPDKEDVIVSPAPVSHAAYSACGVRCESMEIGRLSFACDSLPQENLEVNLLIVTGG